MTYRATIQADLPDFYWPMDEASGTTLTDLIAGKIITLTNATVNQTGLIDGVCVSFNGTTAFGQSSTNLDLTAFRKVTVECLLFWNSYTNLDRIAFEHTAAGDATNGGFLLIPNASVQLAVELATKGNVGVNDGFMVRPTVATWHHVVAVFDYGHPAATEVTLYVDGALKGTFKKSNSSSNSGVFANSKLNLFARNGASMFGAGKMQHLAIYGTHPLSASQISDHGVATGFGLRQACQFAATDLWNNGRSGLTTPYFNEESSLKIRTVANSLEIGTRCDQDPTPGNVFGYIVDGVVQPAITNSGVGTYTITLTPPGVGHGREVELINTYQQGVGAVYGAYIVDCVAVEGAAQIIAPETIGRIVGYGDSIISGAVVNTAITTGSFVGKLKYLAGRPILLEAWCSRALYEDCGSNHAPDATKAAAFAARIAGYFASMTDTNRILFTIGVVDYWATSQWNATNFGLAYADILDRLHALLPNTKIYCMTPIITTREAVTNTYGELVSAYRAQIVTACSTRTGFTQLIDGTLACSPANIDVDAIHPLPAAHVEIFNYLQSIIPPE